MHPIVKRSLVADMYARTGNTSVTARYFGVDPRTVNKWAMRSLQEGATCKFQDAPRTGRPHKLGEEQTSEVLALVKNAKNRVDTARDVKNTAQLEVSIQTVRRILRRADCSYAAPVKKRRLTAAHKAKRHSFGTKHHDVPLPWKEVLFTDSTYIQNNLGKKRWVGPGEQNELIYDKWPIKAHIYAGIFLGGRTDLYFASGTTKKKAYVKGAKGVGALEYREEVIKKLFKPVVEERNLYFMQDGAKPHTAILTKQLLRDTMPTQWIQDWPPNSADLNPIENVWEMLKARVRGQCYRDIDEFKAACLQAWRDIPQDSIDKCIRSLSRRLRAVVAANGGYIPY